VAFFNIEKNNNNSQNTFFNQNPNMYGSNNMDPNMMNQQPMNQGWGMNPNMMNQQPMMDQNMYNQPMMDPNFGMQQFNNMMNQQPMFNQSDMNQNMMSLDNQQPMVNQQPMFDQPLGSDTFMSNVSNAGSQQPMNQGNDSFEVLGENNFETETLQMSQIAEPNYNQTPNQEMQPAMKPEPVVQEQPVSNPQAETLNLEASLPREIEKENMLDNPGGSLGNPTEVPNNLNPLDNANNPIPVNPILAQMEKHQNVEEIGEQKEVKANLFAAIGIILGMIIKPGTTMLNNAKRFKEIKKAISIMIWLAVIFLVVCIGVRIGVGSFDRVYSSLTDSYKMVFNPARIFELSNYLEYIILAVSISLGGVLLTALIYYASSFLNSKGVHFATYLVVSNLGLIPFICGVIILCPVCMIFSTYLGLGALIFSFLCSLITLLIGMNEVLRFNSINSQIFYHVINLSIITLVAIVIFVFMLRSGWVVLPNSLL